MYVVFCVDADIASTVSLEATVVNTSAGQSVENAKDDDDMTFDWACTTGNIQSTQWHPHVFSDTRESTDRL